MSRVCKPMNTFWKVRLAVFIVMTSSFTCLILFTDTRWTHSLPQRLTLDILPYLRTVSRDSPHGCPPTSSDPTAYVITPTYQRLTQEADLLRLCYTLMHAPHVRWIIVEDSDNKTELVYRTLQDCHGPDIIHLNVKSLPPGRRPGTNQMLPRHRGVSQRNEGLAWLRKCVLPTSRAGGVYFADDDNTYDVRVFDVVRKTNNISMWRVGFAGRLLSEGPVCLNGKVTGWRTAWAPRRRYPVDMAGFAIGLDLLAQFPEANLSHEVRAGHLETEFVSLFNIPRSQITPAPDDNCSTVLVWHTKTVIPNIYGEQELAKKNAQDQTKHR
ncbi:galactosylgalactosylxylosylprotein 3-beta-glucuronosyltransferase I-like isoform X2 [Pomacea canaliculata]|nr:galactosylgalactosylxylosylprotein 3-beta-glucuronosyltransferase I-like isoform X2 [Pomacea canaliculata]XP_025106425.1 galactosylgalactosylxylosylprotein 3-beta-glucuronosyltransferase I-like isoform X2 [Pomacea canaliculata]